MFTKTVTKTVDIVEDKKVVGTVNIRKLSARALDKAREAKQINAAQLTAKMGSEALNALRDAAKVREEVTAEVAADPDARYQAYERDHVLRAGITSWTFKDDDGKDVPLDEGIDDLDETSASLLFKAIVDLSDPAPEVSEEDQKKVQGVTPTS